MLSMTACAARPNLQTLASGRSITAFLTRKAIKMIVKKNLALVLLCLVPTALVLLYSVVSEDCLDEQGAKVIFDQAVQLEKDGNLKDAYIKYKIVDAMSCENSELRAKAFDRAVAIKEALNNP